ncbi:MAG: bifunctional demethylmenaquinone methyltransferase/2-methoxy-6-polyprenyl-1,4-benzoquinol methylase UbiE [Bacteroidales bacterium]|nr:bifunctional demethylmenaquinone methyltransferase/2-methoxy-6-polyprenyl-1,4-benzoquinol methylase UbiE [Bacteroidales bacterium]
MAYDFSTIACTYDRLNRIMTFGLDRCWRKRAVKGLHGNVLDVACGTGDMMVELMKQGCSVTGVDISEEMLDIARLKVKGERLMLADVESLPFEDNTFDAVTCAFGVRNFVHLEQGLSEMLRVLKPGGTMVILELATPDSPIIRPFYNFYTKHIIPWLGSRIAGNREAYIYLPESIERFPKGDDFLKVILNSQFSILSCCQQRLTFGVCRLYIINKEVAVPGRPLCHINPKTVAKVRPFPGPHNT